jgi:thymidylate synthase ThyX
MKTKISATVVGDSISPTEDRITTMLVTLPRFILAELNTHRMMCRNSASSRAIPFKRMLEMVQEDPFIPIAWQKDHPGMQGKEYLDEEASNECRLNWLGTRDRAVRGAIDLTDLGCTKQLCNRLLEPFMWHTVLITATEWENFFYLRCPKYQLELEDGDNGKRYVEGRSKKDFIKNFLTVYPTHGQKELVEDYLLVDNESKMIPNDNIGWFYLNKGQAEIHMMALAEAMWDAYNESQPRKLKEGEWHIPFEDRINMVELDKYYHAQLQSGYKEREEGYIPAQHIIDIEVEELKVKVATVMAARTSYTTIDHDLSQWTIDKYLKKYDELSNSGHWSPFEHCARVMFQSEYSYWAKTSPEIEDGRVKHNRIYEYGWCANYLGYVMLRKEFENENIVVKN